MAAPLPDDVFRALGVPRDADAATVKRAYRALAKRNHPDANPDDPGARARFDRVNQAYAAWQAASGGPAVAPAEVSPDQLFAMFEGMFADAFKRGKRGADRSMALAISHLESRDGCVREVAIARSAACTRCRGTGSDDGVTHPCARCHGSGHETMTQGYFHIQSTCRACKGRGRYADVTCEVCDHGIVELNETIVVTLPPGATQVRVPGKGDEVVGGEPGDLYLEIAVETIGILVRRGDDVVLETLVGARHVLLGGAIEVASLDGPVHVRVPRGVRDGDTVTLAGRGHVRATGATSGDPYRDVARGDQIVVFRISPDVRRANARYIVGVVATAAAAALGLALAL